MCGPIWREIDTFDIKSKTIMVWVNKYNSNIKMKHNNVIYSYGNVKCVYNYYSKWSSASIPLFKCILTPSKCMLPQSMYVNKLWFTLICKAICHIYVIENDWSWSYPMITW